MTRRYAGHLNGYSSVVVETSTSNLLHIDSDIHKSHSGSLSQLHLRIFHKMENSSKYYGLVDIVTSEREARSEFSLGYGKNLSMSGPARPGPVRSNAASRAGR